MGKKIKLGLSHITWKQTSSELKISLWGEKTLKLLEKNRKIFVELYYLREEGFLKTQKAQILMQRLISLTTLIF